MKFSEFKFWHVFAFLSGTIIAAVMALASISYNATLGTTELAFSWLPFTNRSVFSTLALAFDLGMIASTFGFWHWRSSNRIAAVFCIILFVIASVFSVHSVRGYIALNVTKSLAPAKRNVDVYTSIKQELVTAQNHLGKLRSALLKARGRKRSRLSREIKQQSRMIHDTRNTLARAKISFDVTPMAGLEWFLAICLWFFNATCWTAWFGTGTKSTNQLSHTPRKVDTASSHHSCNKTQDSVNHWLTHYQQKEAEHCILLFQRYEKWCKQHAYKPLSQYSFYARLIELGAQKFRDGKNGETRYKLPTPSSSLSGEESHEH